METRRRSLDLLEAFARADGLPTSELEITGGSEDQVDLSVHNKEQLEDLLSKYKRLHESMGPKMKDGGQKFLKFVEKIENEQEERESKPEKTGGSPCAPQCALGEAMKNYRDVSQNVDMQGEQRKRSDFTKSNIEMAEVLHGVQKSAQNARPFNQRRKNPAITRMKEAANTSLQQSLEQPVNVPNVKMLAKRRCGATLDTAMELSDDEEKWLDNVSISWPAVSSQHSYGLRSSTMGKGDFSITYPRGDPVAVEVRQSDMKHLNDFEFLNDTIIDFYIKYIQEMELVTEEKRNMYYFFNTFFYKKLLLEKDKGGRYFCELQKWTRGTNIFGKKYLFFPIHDRWTQERDSPLCVCARVCARSIEGFMLYFFIVLSAVHVDDFVPAFQDQNHVFLHFHFGAMAKFYRCGIYRGDLKEQGH